LGFFSFAGGFGFSKREFPVAMASFCFKYQTCTLLHFGTRAPRKGKREISKGKERKGKERKGREGKGRENTLPEIRLHSRVCF